VVDGGIQLDVGVTEHTFDVAGVNFDDEVADTDEVEAHGAECAEESV